MYRLKAQAHAIKHTCIDIQKVFLPLYSKSSQTSLVHATAPLAKDLPNHNPSIPLMSYSEYINAHIAQKMTA